MTRALNKVARHPNSALSECRVALGLSHEKLAYKVCQEAARRRPPVAIGTLESVTRHIKRIESGDVRNPSSVYKSLLCSVAGKSEAELFGELLPELPSGDTFSVSSHKFVPGFVGHEQVSRLVEHYGLQVEEQTCGSPNRYTGTVSHPDGTCRLYVYPFGVALYHLIEPLTMPSIAALARWRRSSYRAALRWATDHLSDALGYSVEASYVLSLYWLHEGIWASSELETALRLLAMPSVLRGEDSEQPDDEEVPNAELVEAALLRSEFSHPGITDYGVMGVSIGYASWAGVAYHPLTPGRALTVDDLVEVELLVQALWCYCHHIVEQVEHGDDPDVPAQYGFRFLRGLRSRCSSARPQEGSQHRSMRTAILTTSDLTEKLNAAIAILRDA